MRKVKRTTTRRQLQDTRINDITAIRSTDTYPGVEIEHPFDYVVRDSSGNEHRFGTRQERDRFVQREAQICQNGTQEA